jgi:hypothetical protein
VTAPSVARLLISHITLRGPELRQLYEIIRERPEVLYEDLVRSVVAPVAARDPFGLEEATLREALNFLLVAGMVEQRGSARRKASFSAAPSPPDSDIGIPLMLLNRIGQLADERQRAIGLVHRHLVDRDALAFTLAGLRDDIERGPYGHLFAWTGEKIGFWAHLAAYLGLVRRLEREVEGLVVPQPSLVLGALGLALSDGSVSASLDTCLRAIDRAYFACFTRAGRVHRGLAQTLIALHRMGHIHLTHRSDATHSVLLGDWRVSEFRLAEREAVR